MHQPQTDTTAIVIALHPDRLMYGVAGNANAMLRAAYPAGFRLDAERPAHTSIYAGFVRTADLPKVYAATGAVLANEDFASWKLDAVGYHYVPLGPVGLAGMVIEPTLGLIRMQQDMIDAAGPYTVRAASAEAFYRTPREPEIHPAVVDYVARFADHTGRNFNPHVTIGLAETGFLDALIKEPFNRFTFSPAFATIYQIGDYGTARKELQALPIKTPA